MGINEKTLRCFELMPREVAILELRENRQTFKDIAKMMRMDINQAWNLHKTASKKIKNREIYKQNKLETDLKYVGITGLAYYALKEINITTVRELLNASNHRLAEITNYRGVGEATLKRVFDLKEEINLSAE